MLRYFTHKKGFSLIELLIALSILAVVAAIIIPKYLGIQKQANIQVANDQAATLRQALGNWSSSFASIYACGNSYGSTPDLIDNTSTPNASGVFSSGAGAACLADFLDSTMTGSNLTLLGSSGGVYAYSTAAMRAVTGTVFSNITVRINGTDYTVAPYSGATHAHIRIYWPTAGSVRRVSIPTAVLFLPN